MERSPNSVSPHSGVHPTCLTIPKRTHIEGWDPPPSHKEWMAVACRPPAQVDTSESPRTAPTCRLGSVTFPFMVPGRRGQRKGPSRVHAPSWRLAESWLSELVAVHPDHPEYQSAPCGSSVFPSPAPVASTECLFSRPLGRSKLTQESTRPFTSDVG